MSEHDRIRDGYDVPGTLSLASVTRRSGARKMTSHRRARQEQLLLLILVCVLGWLVHAQWSDIRAVWDDQPFGPSAHGNQTLAQASLGAPFGGFDLSQLTIPGKEILSGGPPKDGIPALTNPRMIAGGDTAYLKAADRVIGMAIGDEARAYPLAILNYHEIVNDRVGGVPVAITYCPLCDSAAAFDRRTPLGEREFGVSGLLYNSNVLLYDRGGRPESLWSQLKAEGVSGPGAEKTLRVLPVELTSWSDWLARHPNTLVLSPETGHQRDYSRNPYARYLGRPQLMFAARPSSNRLQAKARILGAWTDRVARAYPESSFNRERTRVEDEIDGKRIVIEFNPDARSLRVTDADDGIQWMYSFWFAWYAFHPNTSIFGRDR